MPLTDVACRNAKAAEKRRKMTDGGGLFLLVQPTGSKLWRQAYRFGGKQKLLSHGSYPAVSLQDARQMRDAARGLLAKGIDPGEKKKVEKATAHLMSSITLASVGRDWFEARKAGWTPAYAERIWRRIESDVFTKFGNRPIAEIEPPELLSAIRQIENRGAIVLAKRVLQATGQIFRFAIATGRASRDPTQDLRGALKSPGAPKRRTALKNSELGVFLNALSSYPGDRQTVLALRLVIHTMVRTGEARFARWEEFEWTGTDPIWRIPAERMKMRSGHLVPLSDQVVHVLRELKTLAGDSPYVLPSATKSGVISENTLIYGLYRLGYHSRATVHGFRGTASTILNENGFNRDWIERQLAHADRDEVRAAYNSAEWLVERRRMLKWWSNYLVSSEQSAFEGHLK